MVKEFFKNKKAYLAVLLMVFMSTTVLSGCDIEDFFKGEVYGLNLEAVQQQDASQPSNYYYEQVGIVTVNDEESTSSYFYDEFKPEEEITIKAIPANNFEFVGWFTDYSSGVQVSENVKYTFVMPNNYLSYYAHFVRVGYEEVEHTITFDANGGNFPEGNYQTLVSVMEGESLNELMPEAPVSENYEFLGWMSFDYYDYPMYAEDYNYDESGTASNPDDELSSLPYFDNYPNFFADTIILRDSTVYAVWDYTIEYVEVKIEIKTDGVLSQAGGEVDIYYLEGYYSSLDEEGSSADYFEDYLYNNYEFSFTQGEELLFKAVPHEGYDFVGWFSISDSGNYDLLNDDILLEYTADNDEVIYAKFESIQAEIHLL